MDAAAAGLVVANAPLALGGEELKKLEEAVTRKTSEIAEAVQKALRDEAERTKTISAKTNEQLTELATQAKASQDALVELKTRLLDIEQKGIKRPAGDERELKSPGQLVAGSAELQAAVKARRPQMDAVDVGSFHKTAILNATGQNQPLVPADRRPGVITPAERLLTIRRVLPVTTTESNAIEFASEATFTNNAAPQGADSSPPETEGQLKAESAMTFSLSTTPVITLAHWIPASRQVLADAKMLAGHIDGRLTYGLKLEEEDQVLNGDGTGGALNGLLNQATDYNRGASNDTRIDTLLKAMLQTVLSEYAADGHVISQVDWYSILLLKDTQGRYLFGDPSMPMSDPRIWGLPVVPTNSIATGTFLTGAFGIAAELFDREQASVRVAEQHADFAVRNMVAVIAEERLALAVYRAAALITGTFPTA
jgi:HK97 family phage major capsid protein